MTTEGGRAVKDSTASSSPGSIDSAIVQVRPEEQKYKRTRKNKLHLLQEQEIINRN